MANKQHLIEINGKLYDAVSGKPAGLSQANPRPASRPASLTNVDGISHPVTISIQQASDRTDRAASRDRSKSHRTQHPAKRAHVNKTAQKSQTLMRSAVKKPLNSSSSKGNELARQNISKSGKISPHRLSRAEKTARSSLVSRFNAASHKSLEPQIMALAVQGAPATSSRPISATQARNTEHGKLNIDRALNAASSHDQPKASKPRKLPSSKLVKYASVVASILLLGGYFAYNSLPHLSVRIASTRSGVDASLPDYQPAGFDLSNKIAYSPGEVKVNYNSNSDDRSFTLTQKKTELDEQKLLKEEIAADKKPYQTLEQQGKTVYLKGNGAMWLDDGKLYQIDGNTALSSEQLLRLANSL